MILDYRGTTLFTTKLDRATAAFKRSKVIPTASTDAKLITPTVSFMNVPCFGLALSVTKGDCFAATTPQGYILGVTIQTPHIVGRNKVGHLQFVHRGQLVIVVTGRLETIDVVCIPIVRLVDILFQLLHAYPIAVSIAYVTFTVLNTFVTIAV